MVLEREIRACISQLITANQEISVGAIQEHVKCSEQEIVHVLNRLNLLDDAQVKNSKQETTVIDALSQKAGAFNAKAPVLVDATIYQMQSTFSTMAHQLWESLAQAAKDETALIKQQSAGQLDLAQEKLSALENELNSVTESLQTSEQARRQEAEHHKTLADKLVDAQHQLQNVDSQVNTLNQVLESAQKTIVDQEEQITQLKEQLALAENQALTSSRKLERAEKEKSFLTTECKNTQIELLKAENIISDLYQDNLIEAISLEKLGYKKHLEQIPTPSLTTKLFNNKHK